MNYNSLIYGIKVFGKGEFLLIFQQENNKIVAATNYKDPVIKAELGYAKVKGLSA